MSKEDVSRFLKTASLFDKLKTARKTKVVELANSVGYDFTLTELQEVLDDHNNGTNKSDAISAFGISTHVDSCFTTCTTP